MLSNEERADENCSSDNENENVNLQKIILRQYQIELSEIAKTKNSIIFLPTGSGKTIIAIDVLRSKHKYLLKKNFDGKIAVFLTNTRPLAVQLCEIIREVTYYNVGIYLGEMGVHFWSKKTWDKELYDKQVLVMTAAVFLIIVQKNIICIEKVALLVLDECHHAVFFHPFNEVMREIQLIPEYKRPLILGLTATLLNSNPRRFDNNPFKLVQTLKSNLCSTIATTDKLNEILKYSSIPKEVFIDYEVSEESDVQHIVHNLISECTDVLKLFKIKTVQEVQAENVVPENCDLLCKRNVLRKEMTSLFGHLGRTLKDLGLYGGFLAALFYLVKLERLKFIEKNPVGLRMIMHVITILNVIRRILARYMQEDDIRSFSSHKINRLIDFVINFKNNCPERDLTCIIFVRERITAIVLANLFNNFSRLEKNNFFKADYVIGGLFNSVYESEEAAEERRLNHLAIEKLKLKEYHFLFATNVIEEGIDLPTCNLIIKMDDDIDYKSYIQSRGRARFQDGTFAIFCETGKMDTYWKKIRSYKKLWEELMKVLKPDVEITETFDEGNSKDEEIYYTAGLNGPHITGGMAIQCVYRYCSKLPQDSYSFLSPLCWYNSKEKVAFLQLPYASPLRSILKGNKKDNRSEAKKSVFLKTVIELHKLGEILDDFSFRQCKVSETDYKELFPHFKEENAVGYPDRGTGKRKQDYDVQYAECLSNCLPFADKTTYLHVIEMKSQFSRPCDPRKGIFYDLLCDSISYGLLSSKKLSKICDFPLFLNMGEFNCTLRINAKSFVFSESEIMKFRKFHFFLFNNLLNVVRGLQIFDKKIKGNSFYVVPVKNIGRDEFVIYWDGINLLMEVDENSESCEVICENPTIEDYHLSVIYPLHRESLSAKYYIVTSVDYSQTPMSKFPSEDYENYYSYFKTKYNVEISNTSQPLLEVKLIPNKINYLKPRKVESNKKKKFEDENESHQEHLIPELSRKLLIPASLWLKSKLLPTALYRITSIYLVDEIRKKIASETNLGVCDVDDDFQWAPVVVDDSYENCKKKKFNDYEPITTKSDVIPKENSELQKPLYPFRNLSDCAPCDLKHYLKYYVIQSNDRKAGRNHSLKTGENQRTSVTNFKTPETPNLPVSCKNNNEKGPELRDFLKAFTCKSANDIFNLERLEFFGDSFLKFSVSLFLFRNYNNHEGVLTTLKSKVIGNRNLYYCAIAKNLHAGLVANEFDPESDWNPPLFCIPQEIKDMINENPSSFEIDYFFKMPIKEKIAGQISPETLRTINSIISNKEKRSGYTPNEIFSSSITLSDKSISDSIEALLGLYVKECGIFGGFQILNWLNIIPNQGGSYEELMINEYIHAQKDADFMMKYLEECSYETLEEILGYKFRNKLLLLEAITHPSFESSRIASYQRLEFLGDAILDFVTTIYIYFYCSNLKPGEMTNIRSSLVNNVTLACLTVKFGFHKCLLHHSPELLNSIKKFICFQKERNHKVDFTMLITSEEEEGRPAESTEVPKALGDVFESLIGAVFLDSCNSLQTVWCIFNRLMRDVLDEFSKDPPISPVSMLYEMCKPKPEFRTRTVFAGYVETCCKIIHEEKEKIFVARGRNKEKAKLCAAKLALSFLCKSAESKKLNFE